MTTVTTSSFHFDVEACTCADCSAIRTPTPEHHVETLEIEGPTPVANLVEMCSHGERGDLLSRRDAHVDIVRHLLSLKYPSVSVYKDENGKPRASVMAEVCGVTVLASCAEGAEGYRLLLAAKLASDAAMEARHAL